MTRDGTFWLSRLRDLGYLGKTFLAQKRVAHFFLAIWVAGCFCLERFELTDFVDHQVISPIEFRTRRWLGKGPSLSPNLKIYAFDDLSIKQLGEAYFPFDLWPPLIEGLNQANPRMILGASQFAFEKKGLSSAAIQRIEKIAEIGAPFVSSAIFSATVLEHRRALLDDHAWRSVPGLSSVRSYHYPQAFAYGPEGPFRIALPKLGHVYQPWTDQFAPLVKIQGGQLAPHLGLHAASTWEVSQGELYMEGKKIPINRHGLSIVNFIDPDDLTPHIKTIISLFPKINDGTIGDIIKPNDVVLIVGSFATGASSFSESPFGSIPNAYFLASTINSIMTGDWISTYESDLWLICLFAVLGYGLGWSVSNRIYIPVAIGTILAILALDLLVFTFLSVRLLFFVPCVSLLGSSAIAFNTRLREEQRRKLSIELEQKTAAILQKDFLPAPQLSTDTIELVCHYQAAQDIGGDWYSYYLMDDRWLFFHVADVTGHGAPSALCASYAKGSIDAIHRAIGPFSPEDPPLYHVHQQLNDILNREGSERFLITLVSIAIDLVDGKLWHFNSGHPPGVVVDQHFQKVSHLRAIGTPIIGFGPDFDPIKPKYIDLKAGDFVVLYTDGLASVIKKLVRDIIHGQSRTEKTAFNITSSQELQDHILHLYTEKYAKDLVEHDDITLAVIQFKGPATARPLKTDK